MKSTMTLRLTVAVAVVTAALTGCGGPASNATTSGPSPTDKVQDVADMLKEYQEAFKKPPGGLNDLADATASHPVGHAAVASGEFVVFWRSPVSASGAGTVLAHPKDAATAGGAVVMQDGSVRQMTAAEFAAAPKAKK